MPVPGAAEAWSSLFGTMKDLRAAWPSRGWSWDARHSCACSSFSVDFETSARAAAGILLSGEWTAATIGRAPAALRDLAERTGGLRSGQIILTSRLVGSSFAYGLWWPWGDGMTTSMRIGLDGAEVTSGAMQRLRDTFGVEV